MKIEMEDLKNKWREAKTTSQGRTLPVEQVIELAKAKKRTTLSFHYGNIAILTLVLTTILIFFYTLFPFQELLSRTGIALMAGGLVVRILVEVFSTFKSLKIDVTNHALKTANDTLDFYNFRKKIHGPVTITLVAIYIIGFYMLTPEFSKYIALKWIILLDGSFLLGAIFLIWQIRKGILEEMKNLSEMVELRREMVDE